MLFFTKIDKLVGRSFFAMFFLTFAVVLFILLLVFMAKYFEDLVGKDLGMLVLLELIFYFSMTLVPQALPLSVLLSSLITFGNLGEHNELTAIKCSGTPLTRVLIPIGVYAFILMFAAFYFNNKISPTMNLKAFSLLYDIRQKNPSLDIKEKAFYNGLPGWSIRVEDKNPLGDSLKNIMIYDHTGNRGNTDLIVAKAGTMNMIEEDRFLLLNVRDGYKYSDQRNPDRPTQNGFIRDKFDEATFVFNANFGLVRTPEELFQNNRLMKDVQRLQKDADSLYDKAEDSQKEVYETSQKYYDYLFAKERDSISIDVDSLDASYTFEGKKLSEKVRLSMYDRAITKATGIRNMIIGRRDQILQYQRNARRELIELNRKFTFSVAVFIMFLIGAPLGAIIKKGGLGMPVIISVVFFIIFYVMDVLGDRQAREGAVSIFFGSWAGNMLLLSAGLFFLYQARKDSRLFESDAYAVMYYRFKKYVNKIRKKNTPTS